MFLPDKGRGVDGHSLPMDGLQDAMVGAWHLGQHSADGVSVSGVGQHRQMRQQVMPKSKVLLVSKTAGLGTEEARC